MPAMLFVCLCVLTMSALAQQPVVVELFTSEGCSSCPPADKLLIKLSQQRHTNIANLIVLEEHVEYWNQGGFTDRFSGPTYTERQADYVKQFHLATAYTPQIVVDGHAQTSGNNGQAIQQLILNAAKTPKPAEVSLALTSPEKLQITVNGPDGAHMKVVFAVTEDDLVTSVRGGENNGRTLSHSATVHELRQVGSSSNGKFEKSIDLPAKPAWNKQNLRAIVLVEDAKSGTILGAADIAYPATNGSTPGK